MDEKEKFHYICDAEISNKNADFSYMCFKAESREAYSKALGQFPHGAIVEVYVKIKNK